MTKRLALALVAVAALFALTGAPASAQDGPSITVDPEFVEAPGEQEFTVTGSGWTVASAFVLPCIVVEDLTQLDAQGGDCDLANLTPVTNDGSGGFEATVTYDIPEEGLLIVVGDADQTESAFHIVTVGAPAEEGGEEEAAAEEEEAAGEEEELANTGVESGVITVAVDAVTGRIAPGIKTGAGRGAKRCVAPGV